VGPLVFSNFSLALRQAPAYHTRRAMEYHTIYTDLNPVETEWDELQRKHGNLPDKPRRAPAPKWTPAEDATPSCRPDEDAIDVMDNTDDIQALRDMEDDEAVQDSRFLEAYRQERLMQLQASATGRGSDPSVATFGSLQHVQGSEFVKEVTEASQGAWVVCHLYKDAVEECGILNQCLGALAAQYSSTKFVKIVSTQCIPDFDDRFLPTLLLYKDGKCVSQVARALDNWGGKETSVERVALGLKGCDPGICCEDEAGLRVEQEMVRRILEERLEKDEGDEDSDFD